MRLPSRGRCGFCSAARPRGRIGAPPPFDRHALFSVAASVAPPLSTAAHTPLRLVHDCSSARAAGAFPLQTPAHALGRGLGRGPLLVAVGAARDRLGVEDGADGAGDEAGAAGEEEADQDGVLLHDGRVQQRLARVESVLRGGTMDE